MVILNGIRALAFIALLINGFFAFIHQGFLSQNPLDSQTERWLAQRNDYLSYAAIALGIVLVCSLIIWLAEKAAEKREQQRQDLIAKAEKRVHSERDNSDRINERNARQIQKRWNQELKPTD